MENKANNSNIKVGWIGTGVMGKSMCKHLLKNGYDLYVYNRTLSKCDDLVQLGAKLSNPKAIAETCGYVFLMLGYPHDVEDMVYNPEHGMIHHMKPGSYLVDHTTSSPDLAEKIYNDCKTKNINSYDAPVSGGDVGARDGRLVVMIGGQEEGFENVKAIMNCYSLKINLMGTAGKGQHTKMCNQVILSGNMIGATEGLLYAYKAGLSQTAIIELLGGGAASSFSLNNLGPRMVKGDFEPGFYVEHFLKDLKIALDECKKMNLQLRGLELARSLYDMMVNEGYGKKGTQGLYMALAKLNKIME